MSNENSSETIKAPVQRQGFLRELMVQGALQLACLLPFVSLYLNWASVQQSFLPAATSIAPLMLKSVPGQIDLGQIFAIVAALFTASFFAIFAPSKGNRFQLASALVVGTIAQSLVLTRSLQFPLAIDDPFIDFRYVYNWISGTSFDYNPGSQLARVQGFSSPLHLFLLYISSAIFRFCEIARVSSGLNLVLQITNLLLVFAVAVRNLKYRPLAWVAVLLYAFAGSAMLAAIDNKESALVQLLILLSLLTHRQWCPTIAALLSLARPEGIIWFIREFVCDIVERGKDCIKPWLPALAVVTIWYGFTYCYYGSAIPHGALGRSSMFHSFPHLIAHSCPFILTTVGVDVFHHLFVFLPNQLESQGQILTIENLVKGAAAFILLLYFARKEEWLASYAYNSVLLLLFFAIFDPWMFSWYYSWFSLIAVFVVPLVLQSTWSMAQSSSGILIRASGAVLLTVVSATQLIDLSLVNWLADKNRSSINQYVAESIHNTFFVSNPAMQRLSVYKQAADFLQSQNQAKGNGKARMTLATWEPGVLGYYLPGSEIIDLGGLVTDETLQYYPVPLSERSRREVWGSIPAQAIVEMKPEQVIFFDSFADNGLLKNKQFLETYKLSQFWPLELWGGHGLFLFERQKTN